MHDTRRMSHARFKAGDMITPMAWVGGVRTHRCHSIFSSWVPSHATTGNKWFTPANLQTFKTHLM